MLLTYTIRFLVAIFIVSVIAFSSGALRILVSFFTQIVLVLLFLSFLLSLRAERTPFITRYALLMGAEDSYQERRYTRIVTWVWVMFFLFLLLLKLVAGAQEAHWFIGFSFVDPVFYAGSVVLFIGEFYIRQLFLPTHRGSSLFAFLYKLTKIPLKRVWDFDAKA